MCQNWMKFDLIANRNQDVEVVIQQRGKLVYFFAEKNQGYGQILLKKLK